MKEVTAILKKTLLFKNLDGKTLRRLAESAVEKNYDRQAVLFSAGEIANGLFVITKGSVREFCLGGDGHREQILFFENSPSTVAETAIFGEGRHFSTVVTEKKTQAFFLEKDFIQSLYFNNPSFAIDYLKVLGMRLRRLEDLVEDLTFYTVNKRLTRFILSEADRCGEETKTGEIFLNRNLTHNKIAARIGTVREVVSRNLKLLRSSGLLRFENRRMIISDKEKLAKFFNSSNE